MLWGSSWGWSGWDMKLTAHLHLVPIRMSGAMSTPPHMPSRCGQRELLLYFNYAKTWTWITKTHLVSSKVKNITQQYFTTTIKKSHRIKHLYKKILKNLDSMSHINYHHHPTSDFTMLQALVGSLYWHTATKGHCMCHCHTISWKMASLLETVECHRTQCDSVFVCGGSTMSKILLCGSHIIQQGWPTSTHWRATQLVRTHPRSGLGLRESKYEELN